MVPRLTVLLVVLMSLAVMCVHSPVALWAEEKAAESKAAKEVQVVEDGKTVKVHYTLTVEGKDVDSSRQREPLEVTVGAHSVIPGFENALKGMKVGEKKSFQVAPAEGYGQEDARSMIEIPKSQLPPDLKPEVGMTLYTKGQDGQPIPARIAEVKQETVIMNFNHPLAGKTLNFDIEVIEIK